MHAVKEGHSTASFWVSKCLYDSIFRVFSDHSDEDRYNTRNIFCIFLLISMGLSDLWAYGSNRSTVSLSLVTSIVYI